jgi:hypothetical protein
MGIRDWIQLDTIRHLVKHMITCCVCLLLAIPAAWLLRLAGEWGDFPPQVVTAIEWVEYAYVLLVLVIFAVGTIKSIWKEVFDGSTRYLFA